MKVNTAVTNLTAGEVTPRLDGRPDVTKQRNGLRVCENFQVVVHGGLRKRSGTQFVCEVPNETQVLQPFNYSTEDSYMLIWGPGYVWIARTRGLATETPVSITGITQASPGVVTTGSAHGLGNGNIGLITGVGGMTQMNNRLFRAANVTGTTFELDEVDYTPVNTTGYSAFTSGGTVSKLVVFSTPYTASDLQDLRFAQYNDVMYVSHKNYALRKLSRVSNTSWTFEPVSLTTGPFRAINGTASRVMAVAARPQNVTAITRANPCVVTVSGENFFTVGDVVSFSGVGGMTQLNGNSYDVTAINGQTITISVDSSGFTTYTSGGLIASAQTIWSTLPVGSKISLTASWGPFVAGHVGSLWRLSEAGGGTGVSGAPLGDRETDVFNGQVYTSDGNVYGISNESALTWGAFNRVPAHEQGVVRVIGSTAGGTRTFDSSFLHPGYCVVQITGINSATSANATIVRYQMPQSVLSSGTSFWEEGAWSDFRGYPRCCAFFEQRLWLAGSDSEPATIWGSRSSGFENFEDGPDDDDAIVYRASSGYADTIRWLSGGRVLTAGTSQGEYAIAASNQNEALTPDNLRMLLQTTYGTSDCPPVRVNEAVLYPQRNGNPSNASRKLREFTYDFGADQFNSVDITIFAEHITGNGITRAGLHL